MTDYLIFRLYGPMASWGDIAVGEVRPSWTRPSKSAVLGLIAAALRIDRGEEETHRALAGACGFAVRVDSMGVPLVDYHTVQVPPSGVGRNRRSFATRQEEIRALPKEKLNTILSRREYRMDAHSTIALWIRAASPPRSLTEIRAALEEPGYVLYLGRKSCPPALPLEPQIVNAPTVRQAFRAARFSGPQVLDRLRPGASLLCWEGDAEPGQPAWEVFERRDVPLSRRRWQFDVRHEYQAAFDEEG